MPNANIGHIECPFGGGQSDVRKDKKGKLYYYNENTGMVKPNLPHGQSYMKKHTVFIGDNSSPLPPLTTAENSVNENEPEKTANNSVNEEEEGFINWLLK